MPCAEEGIICNGGKRVSYWVRGSLLGRAGQRKTAFGECRNNWISFFINYNQQIVKVSKICTKTPTNIYFKEPITISNDPVVRTHFPFWLMLSLGAKGLEKLDCSLQMEREVLLVFMILNTVYILENLRYTTPAQTSPSKARLLHVCFYFDIWVTNGQASQT